MTRLMRNHGNLAKDWNDMSEAAKAQFITENHGASGEDLMVRLKQYTVMVKTRTSSVEFKGVGAWKSEKDLAEEYRNKPEQLQSLLQNGRKFFDKIKGVVLYEVRGGSF